MNKQTNVLNFPGAEPVNQQRLERHDPTDPLAYWDEVWNVTVKMKEEYSEQDVLTWEDYVNTVVDQFVDNHRWTKFQSFQLMLLSVTNNYDSWLDYGAELGNDPVQVMARCAMVRDVLDFCEGIEAELGEEE